MYFSHLSALPIHYEPFLYPGTLQVGGVFGGHNSLGHITGIWGKTVKNSQGSFNIQQSCPIRNVLFKMLTGPTRVSLAILSSVDGVFCRAHSNFLKTVLGL